MDAREGRCRPITRELVARFSISVRGWRFFRLRPGADGRDRGGGRRGGTGGGGSVTAGSAGAREPGLAAAAVDATQRAARGLRPAVAGREHSVHGPAGHDRCDGVVDGSAAGTACGLEGPGGADRGSPGDGPDPRRRPARSAAAHRVACRYRRYPGGCTAERCAGFAAGWGSTVRHWALRQCPAIGGRALAHCPAVRCRLARRYYAACRRASARRRSRQAALRHCRTRSSFPGHCRA